MSFPRDLPPVAIVLLALAFALVVVIGRRIEGQRDADWKELATQLQSSFEAAPTPETLRGFGTAPWDGWAQGGPLQCARAIIGGGKTEPFALLQVRYALRATHGEDAPEQWQAVVVAALRHAASQPAAGLKAVDAQPGYGAADNGEWLFVWKKATAGAESHPGAGEVRELLRQARQMRQRMPAASATPRA